MKMSYYVYILQIVPFLDLLAATLIVPLLPSHLQRMGASQLYVGLLGSLYSFFQLASGPLIGSLSDLKGRKTILISTLLLCSVVYIILGLTNSIIVILLLRITLGSLKQTQMLIKALVPDCENDEQKQAMIYGKMAAMSGVGITVGPIIGGHIAEDNSEGGFTLITLIVALCFIFNAGLVYFVPTPIRTTVKRNRDKELISDNFMTSFCSSVKESVAELCKIQWSLYWDVFLSKALVGFAMAIYYSNYSLYLKGKFDLSPKYIGYIISFQGVMGALSSLFIGYVNKLYKKDEDYSLRNLHVFLVLSISLFGLILSFNMYIYVLCLVPFAMSSAIGRLVTLEMVLKRSDEEHRGTLIGASNSVSSLAGAVAPMVAGVIGQLCGISYTIYASLFATVIGFVISYHYRSKRIKVD